MASNILVEKQREQNIQILQFQNQKLSEQLANLKQQIQVLDGSVSKYEEEKKQYSETLLCVNRIWDQLNADVQSLVGRCTSNPARAPAEAAAAEAAEGQEQEQLEAWEAFDPFLRRLLSNEAAQASLKAIKRNVQDYQQDLGDVEQALHERSAASMKALSDLLTLIQQRTEAAYQEAERLRALSTDDALKQSNQALHEEVASLQQQLHAAQALQRSTQALLKQFEDRAFEAAENLKSIKNDLADKEYALQAAQRKLQRLKQQQGSAAESSGGGGMPTLQPSGGVGGSDAGAGTSAGAVAAAAAGGAGGSGAASQGGDAAGGGSEELQAQLQELQELLEQRTAEKEAEAEAHSKTQRELAEARARIGDETWVSQQSSLYALAQKQLAEAAAQLEGRSKALALLQHEKDDLLRHFETKQAKEEMEKVLRSKVVHLQQQVDELNAKQVELLSQKQAMQMSHQAELSRYGHAKTTSELQAMVAALQKEVDTHAGHARKAAEASAAADTARQEALSARSALTASQSLVKVLQGRLSAKAAELSGLSGREEELKERLNDLIAFVEVLTTFTSDARDVLEVRRSEAALKGQVADLTAKLKGDALQQKLAAVTASEAALRQEVETASAAAVALKGEVAALQDQVAVLQGEVGKKQAESEAFAQEINEAYNAFEEQRQQNATLLGQLTDRDAALASGQAERLGLEHQLAQMGEQLSAARVELTTLRGELGQLAALKEAVEGDFGRISAELAAAREQVLAHSSTIDRLKLDLKAREDEKAALDILLDKEKAAAAAAKRDAEKDATTLSEERAKRQRLEDANKLLTTKVERLSRSANSSETVQELEEEINALRRLLKCNVCHTRQKDVIITKCWHMFCKHCINKNLEARHRKCPGCGHPFGAADVKQFFFT